MLRRTKIVVTLGPATDDPNILSAILRAGVDVARINFSHGTADEHLARVARFRDEADRQRKVAAVLADLPGPKLRVRIPAPRPLVPGEVVHFSLTAMPAHEGDMAITEPEALADVQSGQRILLDDGRLQLVAKSSDSGRLAAEVVVGGTLLENKGLNLPDTPLSIPAVTDRDRAAIAVAAKAGVDWLALSFVRDPSAAEELRRVAAGCGLNVPIMAKIERPEAVSRAGAIVVAFDGIMVARGDLGVETPLEQLPMVQKRLIAEARAHGKPVITATEMLDSMRFSPRPTRAEVSDVANAICDGTDAVMLSGETAVGKYPVEAVARMARIAEETERHLEPAGGEEISPFPLLHCDGIDDPIAESTCRLAREVGAAAIITPTLSGRTARLLARYRPWPRVVAPAPTVEVMRRMAVVWGIEPVLSAKLTPGGDRLATAVRDAFTAGAVKAGDRVVVTAGHPVEGGQRFPTVRVVRVGDSGASMEP
jgi:pyruvate kinase